MKCIRCQTYKEEYSRIAASFASRGIHVSPERRKALEKVGALYIAHQDSALCTRKEAGK